MKAIMMHDNENDWGWNVSGPKGFERVRGNRSLGGRADCSEWAKAEFWNPILAKLGMSYDDIQSAPGGGGGINLDGFTEAEALDMLNTGLKLEEGQKSPFSFKNGFLVYNNKLYRKLSAEQKRIANNIIAVIDNDQDIIVTIKKSDNNTIVKTKGTEIFTLGYFGGGAVTYSDPSNLKQVTVFIDPSTTFDAKSFGIKSTDPEQELQTPLWLVFYHELGGHALLKYILLQGDYESYNAIRYENLLRGFHNLGERAEDENHPNLLRD